MRREKTVALSVLALLTPVLLLGCGSSTDDGPATGGKAASDAGTGGDSKSVGIGGRLGGDGGSVAGGRAGGSGGSAGVSTGGTGAGAGGARAGAGAGGAQAGAGNGRAGAGAGGAQTGSGGAPAAGSGGRQGVGGAIIDKVSDCSGLGEVGEWERLTIPGMPGPGEYVLDPRNPGTLYVGDTSDNKGVYKSSDCGATWTRASTGRNADKVASGGCTTLQIDRTDGTLYANALYGDDGVYKSTNGGVDWDIITPPASQGFPSFVGHLDMDPDDPKHLLALFHTTCEGTGSFPADVGCFAETRNGGATWTPHYHTNPSFPSELMVYLLYGDTWVAAVNQGSNGLMRTTNAGQSWTAVSPLEGGGHSTRAAYRAKDGAFYLGSMTGILRATPGSNGGTWTEVEDAGSWNLGVTGNGTTMWVAGQDGIRSSPEDDGENWELMEGSPGHSDGCTMDPNTFDHEHNVLYVSCFSDGLWRVKVK